MRAQRAADSARGWAARLAWQGRAHPQEKEQSTVIAGLGEVWWDGGVSGYGTGRWTGAPGLGICACWVHQPVTRTLRERDKRHQARAGAISSQVFY